MNDTREGLHNCQGEQGKASREEGGKGACSIRGTDPGAWATLYPSSDRTVDKFSNFEVMASGQDFFAKYEDANCSKSCGAILAVDQFELLLVKMQAWRPSDDIQYLKTLIHYEDEDNYRNTLSEIEVVRERKRYEYYARQQMLYIDRAFHIYGTEQLFGLDCLKSWVKRDMHLDPAPDEVFQESLVLWFRNDLLGVRTNIVRLSHTPLWTTQPSNTQGV